MGSYGKGIAAAVGAAATAIFVTWGDALGLPEGWPELVTPAITAVIVYLIPNKPKEPV